MKRRFGQRLRRAMAAEAAPEAPTRDLLRYREERLSRRRTVVELPEGDVVENEMGACFVRRLEYPLPTMHGCFALGDAHSACSGRLGALAKEELEDFDLSQCLFLDTETTGLSGGAGTVVFMVGIGHFLPGRFVLEQTFLRSFGEEPAALRFVADRLKEHPMLVTFVGKAFDRHRLAARMAVHRVRSRILTSRHLDLYYLARRAFGAELPDVRLQTVERQKLAIRRDDDLPGAEAPIAFLDWIRDRTGPVDRVFEHNRLDVLTLVSLLALLGRPTA